MNVEQYIEQVHREPWHLLRNNCFHKSIRIFRAARRSGIPTNLVLALEKAPKKLGGVIPIILPHAHVIVNGVAVHVGFSPEQEETHWKNSEMKIYLPITLGKSRPRSCKC